MSRAWTPEEVRNELIQQIRTCTEYWNGVPKSKRDCLNGVAFSILNIIDGTSALPAMGIVLRPHPDDKEFNISNGDNWYEDGQVINGDCCLHEMLAEREKGGSERVRELEAENAMLREKLQKSVDMLERLIGDK